MRRLLTLKDLKKYSGMYNPLEITQHINCRCDINPTDTDQPVTVLYTDKKIRRKDEENIRREWGEYFAGNINT